MPEERSKTGATLAERLDAFRRRTLPASINDYQSISARLEQVQKRLDEAIDRRRHEENTERIQTRILSVLRLLEPMKVADFPKSRVGSPADGGYVQLADYRDVSRALSFGINDDDSWDLTLAKAGVPVEQFDHTIERAPSEHPLLAFHSKRISAFPSPDTATLPELVKAHSVREQPDIILKIDIEGCEWEVFWDAQPATLSKLTQILCEFHNLTRLGDADFADTARRALENVTRVLAPIHVHANNNSAYAVIANVAVPDALEVTFVNRKRYRLEPTTETFPTPLDAPNNPMWPDIALGCFKF